MQHGKILQHKADNLLTEEKGSLQSYERKELVTKSADFLYDLFYMASDDCLANYMQCPQGKVLLIHNQLEYHNGMALESRNLRINMKDCKCWNTTSGKETC